jgi:subtilisin family serine protease
MAKTVTVAVIDTGIDKSSSGKLCRYGHKSFASKHGDPLVDKVGHGTHVAGLIEKHAGDGDYCLVSIQFCNDKITQTQNLFNLKRALQYAINLRVDYINISGGGYDPDPKERLLMLEALNNGIKVVVAAGNESINLTYWCNYYPACYDDRIIVVGNLTSDRVPSQLSFLVRSPTSNYGKVVRRWEVGTRVFSNLPSGRHGYLSGTSQATAVATGKIIKEQLSQ